MPIVTSKKRNSILGSLALLIGFSAVGLSAIDVPGLPSVTVGPWTLPFALTLDVGVGALAMVSLLLAAKSRRTGTEIPGAALAVALGAAGVFYFRHRPTPVPVAAPRNSATTEPAVTTVLPSNPVKQPVKLPAPAVPSPAVTNATTAAKNATQQTAAMLRQQQITALRDAKAHFVEAQTRVVDSLKSDPAYLQAKSFSDAADVKLREARTNFPPGDPKLVAVSQTALSARDTLNQMIAQAVAKDPDAAAAKAKLDALTQPN